MRKGPRRGLKSREHLTTQEGAGKNLFNESLVMMYDNLRYQVTSLPSRSPSLLCHSEGSYFLSDPLEPDHVPDEPDFLSPSCTRP
jgi:hypothetical protein